MVPGGGVFWIGIWYGKCECEMVVYMSKSRYVPFQLRLCWEGGSRNLKVDFFGDTLSHLILSPHGCTKWQICTNGPRTGYLAILWSRNVLLSCDGRQCLTDSNGQCAGKLICISLAIFGLRFPPEVEPVAQFGEGLDLALSVLSHSRTSFSLLSLYTHTLAHTHTHTHTHTGENTRGSLTRDEKMIRDQALF